MRNCVFLKLTITRKYGELGSTQISNRMMQLPPYSPLSAEGKEILVRMKTAVFETTVFENIRKKQI